MSIIHSDSVPESCNGHLSAYSINPPYLALAINDESDEENPTSSFHFYNIENGEHVASYAGHDRSIGYNPVQSIALCVDGDRWALAVGSRNMSKYCIYHGFFSDGSVNRAGISKSSLLTDEEALDTTISPLQHSHPPNPRSLRCFINILPNSSSQRLQIEDAIAYVQVPFSTNAETAAAIGTGALPSEVEEVLRDPHTGIGPQAKVVKDRIDVWWFDEEGEGYWRLGKEEGVGEVGDVVMVGWSVVWGNAEGEVKALDFMDGEKSPSVVFSLEGYDHLPEHDGGIQSLKVDPANQDTVLMVTSHFVFLIPMERLESDPVSSPTRTVNAANFSQKYPISHVALSHGFAIIAHNTCPSLLPEDEKAPDAPSIVILWRVNSQYGDGGVIRIGPQLSRIDGVEWIEDGKEGCRAVFLRAVGDRMGFEVWDFGELVEKLGGERW